MTLVRMRPQNFISPNFFQEVDRLLGEVKTPAFGNTSDLDLYETDDQVTLELAVPGIKTEDLDISSEGRKLTISGKYPAVEASDNRRYWVKGIARSEFSRTITLPANIEQDNIQAQVRDGVLTLTMPKAAEAKVKKIAINN
jgi:HSP20 family protein